MPPYRATNVHVSGSPEYEMPPAETEQVYSVSAGPSQSAPSDGGGGVPPSGPEALEPPHAHPAKAATSATFNTVAPDGRAKVLHADSDARARLNPSIFKIMFV